MSTSSVFLAKKGLFPDLFNSSEGSSVGINAIRNKHRTPSIVFRALKPKEVNHLRAAPFLDIWAPFYHHSNGDAAAPAHPRYLKRLPFGIASASAIFQRTIESVLRGMSCTLVRADDILVSGHSDEENLANVEKVLARLADAGLKAKRRKCRMMEPEVIYMGYVVNAHGHRPDPERVSAVLNAPAPKNVAELQSYLGMLNHYGQFIPSLATTLEPLHRLLRREARWE